MEVSAVIIILTRKLFFEVQYMIIHLNIGGGFYVPEQFFNTKLASRVVDRASLRYGKVSTLVMKDK
jgi:hypothetical protein